MGVNSRADLPEELFVVRHIKMIGGHLAYHMVQAGKVVFRGIQGAHNIFHAFADFRNTGNIFRQVRDLPVKLCGLLIKLFQGMADFRTASGNII